MTCLNYTWELLGFSSPYLEITTVVNCSSLSLPTFLLSSSLDGGLLIAGDDDDDNDVLRPTYPLLS